MCLAVPVRRRGRVRGAVGPQCPGRGSVGAIRSGSDANARTDPAGRATLSDPRSPSATIAARSSAIRPGSRPESPLRQRRRTHPTPLTTSRSHRPRFPRSRHRHGSPRHADPRCNDLRTGATHASLVGAMPPRNQAIVGEASRPASRRSGLGPGIKIDTGFQGYWLCRRLDVRRARARRAFRGCAQGLRRRRGRLGPGRRTAPWPNDARRCTARHAGTMASTPYGTCPEHRMPAGGPPPAEGHAHHSPHPHRAHRATHRGSSRRLRAPVPQSGPTYEPARRRPRSVTPEPGARTRVKATARLAGGMAGEGKKSRETAMPPRDRITPTTPHSRTRPMGKSPSADTISGAVRAQWYRPTACLFSRRHCAGCLRSWHGGSLVLGWGQRLLSDLRAMRPAAVAPNARVRDGAGEKRFACADGGDKRTTENGAEGHGQHEDRAVGGERLGESVSRCAALDECHGDGHVWRPDGSGEREAGHGYAGGRAEAQREHRRPEC